MRKIVVFLVFTIYSTANAQIYTETGTLDIYIDHVNDEGYCEAKKIEGQWKDLEVQYVTSIGHDDHSWVYGEIDSSDPGIFYACYNCCSYPDYYETQKRVCRICGLIQKKVDWIEHQWVWPPKSKFQTILDSLKGIRR